MHEEDGAVVAEADHVHHEISRLFIRLMPHMRDHMFGVWAEVGLSPQQAQALKTLQESGDGALSQRDLAMCMGYDPSNITAIADRLEEQGLIERHVDASDRRVKRLVVSARGRAVVERIEFDAFLDSPLVRHLDETEQAQLVRILRKAVDNLPAPGATLR